MAFLSWLAVHLRSSLVHSDGTGRILLERSLGPAPLCQGTGVYFCSVLVILSATGAAASCLMSLLSRVTAAISSVRPAPLRALLTAATATAHTAAMTPPTTSKMARVGVPNAKNYSFGAHLVWQAPALEGR